MEPHQNIGLQLSFLVYKTTFYIEMEEILEIIYHQINKSPNNFFIQIRKLESIKISNLSQGQRKEPGPEIPFISLCYCELQLMWSTSLNDLGTAFYLSFWHQNKRQLGWFYFLLPIAQLKWSSIFYCKFRILISFRIIKSKKMKGTMNHVSNPNT